MVVSHTEIALVWMWRNTVQKLKFFSYATIKTLTGFVTQNVGGKMQEENLPWTILQMVVKMVFLKYSGYPKYVRQVVFYMNLSSAALCCSLWFDKFVCRHPHCSCLILVSIKCYLRLKNCVQLRFCLKITSAIFVTGVKRDISGSLNRDIYVSILMVWWR